MAHPNEIKKIVLTAVAKPDNIQIIPTRIELFADGAPPASAAGKALYLWAPLKRIKPQHGRRFQLICPVKSLSAINCGSSGAVRTGMVRTAQALDAAKSPVARRAIFTMAALNEIVRRRRDMREVLVPTLSVLAEVAGLESFSAIWSGEMNHLIPHPPGAVRPEDLNDIEAIESALARLDAVREIYAPVLLQPVHTPRAQAPLLEDFDRALGGARRGSTTPVRSPCRLGDMSDKELTRAVWARPVTVIARDLGVSHTVVRRTCIRRGIALPPSSYWTKVKAGQDPREVLAEAGVLPPPVLDRLPDLVQAG